MAALIDGEGSIHFAKQKQRSDYCFNLQCRCRISMTERDAVKWAAQTFSGRYNFYDKYCGRVSMQRYPEKEYRRWMYIADFTGHALENMLREVYDYLKIKQPQAELAFSYFSAVREFGNTRRNPQRYDRYLHLFNECKRLNKGDRDITQKKLRLVS